MLTAIVVLSLVSLQLVSAQYGKTTTTKKVDEDAPQVQHYDEVYVAGKNGLKAVTAVSGTTEWKEYNLEAKDNTLYAPKGVAICNGAKDEWGRWAYAYVADAGNDEQPAAVYQYNIVRNAENPGEVAIDSATLIYGGDLEGMEDAAPTDVACDEATGGVFIADANKGQIGWQPKAGDAVDAYTTADCADAVSGVQSVTKAGKYLFWSVSNSNNTEANGVYRADASSEVDCAKAAEASPYLASTDAAVGVAVHNNRVLYTTGSAAVWQASEKFNGDAWEEPEEWNGGYDQAGYIASAGDRGLLIADTGANALYVSKGDGEANEIATVTDCTGVAYYAGEPWVGEGEAEEEEDSASLATVGLLALGVAAAAQL